MALFNHATKEVTSKLVYYGPGLCGKTTNLQWIHDNLQFKNKGKLVSLATESDRTLFFDFLPVELGTIRGMRTRMQIYTVPGQVFYEATRRMVLKGCDAVVFVADSQAAMLDANFESLESLRRNLLTNEIDPAIPMVIQYNKRDLPTALPVSVLNARLNPRDLPFFEAIAFKGHGVEDTLRGITKALFRWLSDYYGGSDAGASKAAEAITAPDESTPAAGERVMVRVDQPTPRPAAPTPPPAVPPAAPTAPKPPPAPKVAPPSPAVPPPARTVPPAAPAPRPAPTATTPPISPKPAAPVARPQPEAQPSPRPSTPAPETSAPPARAEPPVASPPAQPAPPPAAPPPAPTATSAAPDPGPVPDEEPAETIIIGGPQSKVTPIETLDADFLEEAADDEPAMTIRIKKQRVVIPSAPAAPAEPPPAAPPPAAAEPPPEAPTPAPVEPAPAAAPEPPAPAAEPVFRESAPAKPADPPPRGEGLREEQWLYLLDGAQKGPVDIEDLVDLVLTSIPEDTKVWHPGLDGWVLATEARGIAEEIPPPLPVPGVARGSHVEEDMPDFDTVPPQFRTALIADEDEGFRKYLAMPLAAQGFTIHEAADGSAAWQLAVQNRPWLILADVSMPEVDGFEFCQRVRSHPLLSHTPLLFISGSDKYKERYRALQIGADDFLSKQMPIRELLMRIQLLLTKYSDLSAEPEKTGTTDGDQAGAFQGRVEVFGAPALLQMCAQGRLSGLFTALAEDEDNTAATMGFREGEIVSATIGTQTGVDAVYGFLSWEKGSFKFTPGDAGSGEPLAQSVEHLLLEGCRLLDESQKDSGGSEITF